MSKNLSVALIVSIILLSTVSARFNSPASDSEISLFKNLNIANLDNDSGTYMFRHRRSSKSCGQKLLKLVTSICEEGCTAETGIDMATNCCANQCSMDFIKIACCP